MKKIDTKKRQILTEIEKNSKKGILLKNIVI